MRYPFVFLFLLFLIPTGEGQVIGKITDTNGEPLPFANVYVQNTTKGTTSNPDGDYALQLDPGTYEIVYQYIGYQQQIRQVSIRSGVPTVLDIELKADALNLQTIEIKANAEDPSLCHHPQSNRQKKILPRTGRFFQSECLHEGKRQDSGGP
jgi:hypothetical protein